MGVGGMRGRLRKSLRSGWPRCCRGRRRKRKEGSRIRGSTNEERSDDGSFSPSTGSGYKKTRKLGLYVSIYMLYGLLVPVPRKKRTVACGCMLLKVRHNLSGHFRPIVCASFVLTGTFWAAV